MNWGGCEGADARVSRRSQTPTGRLLAGSQARRRDPQRACKKVTGQVS